MRRKKTSSYLIGKKDEYRHPRHSEIKNNYRDHDEQVRGAIIAADGELRDLEMIVRLYADIRDNGTPSAFLPGQIDAMVDGLTDLPVYIEHCYVPDSKLPSEGQLCKDLYDDPGSAPPVGHVTRVYANPAGVQGEVWARIQLDVTGMPPAAVDDLRRMLRTSLTDLSLAYGFDKDPAKLVDTRTRKYVGNYVLARPDGTYGRIVEVSLTSFGDMAGSQVSMVKASAYDDDDSVSAAAALYGNPEEAEAGCSSTVTGEVLRGKTTNVLGPFLTRCLPYLHRRTRNGRHFGSGPGGGCRHIGSGAGSGSRSRHRGASSGSGSGRARGGRDSSRGQPRIARDTGDACSGYDDDTRGSGSGPSPRCGGGGGRRSGSGGCSAARSGRGAGSRSRGYRRWSGGGAPSSSGRADKRHRHEDAGDDDGDAADAERPHAQSLRQLHRRGENRAGSCSRRRCRSGRASYSTRRIDTDVRARGGCAGDRLQPPGPGDGRAHAVVSDAGRAARAPRRAACRPRDERTSGRACDSCCCCDDDVPPAGGGATDGDPDHSGGSAYYSYRRCSCSPHRRRPSRHGLQGTSGAFGPNGAGRRSAGMATVLLTVALSNWQR